MQDTIAARVPAGLKAGLQRALDFYRRFYDDRRFMAGLTALSLIVYLWNAPRAIDYPQFDESYYFARGYRLAHGNIASALVTDLRTSPLIVVYYALWYALLRTDLLYPWVLTSALFLMGMGAYLLFARILHPVLSWALALFAVVAAMPIVPGNALYYFGTAVLWLSLALLGPRVYARGLAVLGVLIASFARPEYLLVLAALVVGLAVYEWRTWRGGKVAWRSLALAYTPAALAGLATSYLLLRGPRSDTDRVESAVPWSYNGFLRNVHPSQFQGISSLAQPWINFDHDFAPVHGPHTLTSTLIAMTHNPPRMMEYLTYEARQIWAALVSATLHGPSWTNDEWHSKLAIAPTAQDQWLFGTSLLLLAAAAVACYLSLRRGHLLATLPVRRNVPALIGIASLALLLGPLVLINAAQRFWMLFPLLLVPVGYGLTCIARRLRLHTSLWLVVIIVGLAVIPEPYSVIPDHPLAKTLAFIRAHVPAGSTIIGEPMSTFQVYLATEGLPLNAYDTATIPEPVLINAVKADPSVRYLLQTSWWYGNDTFQHWFADWNAAFPHTPWKLVAAAHDPAVKLYELSGGVGAGKQLMYDAFVQRAHQIGTDTTALPADTAMDFGAQITWHSANPRNKLQPAPVSAWGVPISAVLMHPYYPGIAPTVPTQMTAQLPAAWSGQSLLFLATLAPWLAQYADVNGVRLTFTLDQGGTAQTFEVNNLRQRNWVPLVVQLPQYAGTATLTVSIQPRVTASYCTTYLGFIGIVHPVEQ
jgi:hypothetical protein